MTMCVTPVTRSRSMKAGQRSRTRSGVGRPARVATGRDADGFCTFEQLWFGGNHSDVGGSYAENELRPSDVYPLTWMADAAIHTVRDGIKIDNSAFSFTRPRTGCSMTSAK